MGKDIATSIIFGALNPSFFNNKKVLQLSSTQRDIVLYTMLSLQYCGSKRIGIYNLSTAEFPRSLAIEEIQNQLGRTDMEISLKLRNAVTPVSAEERDHYRGNLNKYFPDVIEYDPETDMVFSKLAFAYCGINYLNTPAKMIEAIHTEYKQVKHVVPERWLGEFMGINSRRIREAWVEVSTPKPKPEVKGLKKNEAKEEMDEEELSVHKNLPSLKKTFEHLFELEKQYSPFAKKISPDAVKKMKDFLKE